MNVERQKNEKKTGVKARRAKKSKTQKRLFKCDAETKKIRQRRNMSRVSVRVFDVGYPKKKKKNCE